MPIHERPEFDLSNRTSLFNLWPDWLQQFSLDRLDEEDLDRTEDELTGELFGPEAPQMFTRLRISFWDEYDRTIRYQEKKMDFILLTEGICSPNRLKRDLNKQPRILAWLMKPPTNYTALLKEISELALNRQIEVMRLPVLDSKGRPNVKLIEAQLKIFQHIDIRLKGAVVQKIEQKNLNVNVDGSPKQVAAPKNLSLTAVNEEIDRLRKISEALTSPANVTLDAQKLITGETMEAEVISEKPAEIAKSEIVHGDSR